MIKKVTVLAPYASEFNPVDPESGRLISGCVVDTAEEFEGFMNWLGRKANEPLRKMAYEEIAAQQSGRTLLEAKTLLLDKTCGAYVKKLLNTANGEAAWGLSSDINDADKGEIHAKIAAAEGALNKFCHVIKPELFTGQLKKAAMTSTAVERLLASFDGRADLSKNIATLLAVNVKALGRQAQVELPGVVRSYFESAQRRSEIKRGSTGETVDDEFEGFDMLGLFAPLIRFIEKERNPKIKMEMAAHFEDYVRSGWFARDHIDESTHIDCQEGSWWGARHDSALEFRAILKSLGSGKDVPSSVVRDAFAKRVSELALVVICKADQVQGAAPNQHSVERAEHIDVQTLFQNTAAARQPDTFWISPDSSQVWITCATSDETMARQSNQLVRYVKSVLNAIECRVLGLFMIPLGAQMKVEARSLSVSFGQKKSNKAGQQAGASLLECFECENEADKNRLIAAFNTVPFLAMLAGSGKDITPDMAVNFTCDLVGAHEEIWSKCANSNASWGTERARKDGLSAFAKALGLVGKSLSSVTPRESLIYNPSAGGIGGKAYEGLHCAQVYANHVMLLRAKLPAGSSERALMDKHLVPQAASLSKFFTALSFSAEDNNIHTLNFLVKEFGELANPVPVKSTKKKSKSP